jgi:hypothetical protein
LGANVPKITPITKQAVEIINGHIGECKPRKRRWEKNFPLWCALRSAKKSASPIRAVLSGNCCFPFLYASSPKEIIAERIARRYQITFLQFALIDKWLCKNGYYNGHPRSRIKEIPSVVINFRDACHREIETWWEFVLSQAKGDIPLRAIVDQQLTDLILLKSLEITSVIKKRPSFKKEWHVYGM